MGEVERKVFDSDLAAAGDYAGRFNLLKVIAEEYTRDYIGNFDMMIEARTHLAKHGSLPEGSYRPVLNTLRTDIRRRDLWNAVQALLYTPEHVADVVPIERPKREYGGYVEKKEPRRATYLDVRITWKVPFRTAFRAPHSPVVHLFLADARARWWRARLPNHDLDMAGPLSELEVRVKTYCSSYPSPGQLWFSRPTYDEAFPGQFEPGWTPMPFCRSCVRLWEEKPYLAVYKGDDIA